MQRKSTDLIVVHCSATKPSMDIGAKEIRKWHTAPEPKGRGWSDIGYHFVIRRDGTIETGRNVREIGAHVEGHNSHSVGVCLVGGVNDMGRAECNFTEDQFLSLRKTIKYLFGLFGKIEIRGHHDFNTGKDCPSFNVAEWCSQQSF